MASFLEYPDRGVGPYPVHALEFLDEAYLAATVDDVPVAMTVDVDQRLATLAAHAAGTLVRIQRTTPRDQDDRLTQFLDLPTGSAGLTGALLDQDYRQLAHLAVEAQDAVSDLPPAEGMMLGADGQWDAESLLIKNMDPGASPGDLATLAQLDTVEAAARNLPTAVLDADDGLFVTAGEWDDRAPASARTALMLGTVATLTSGVGANNVPAFGAGTPPRYATADGRNIDLTNHSIQAAIALRSRAVIARWAVSAVTSPNADPDTASWSQSSGTRMAMGGTWGARVDLNNGDLDIDGSTISPYRIRLAAGTWRLRWVFKVRMPITGSATNRAGMRITNNDDTSAQTIHYDLGTHRPNTDFSADDYTWFPDSLVLTFGSADSVVFRHCHNVTGGNNQDSLILLIQKIKS